MDPESAGENSLCYERSRLIPRAKGSSRGAVLATCISVLGTLSFGYCVGYSSPASYDLKSATNVSIRLSPSQESWFSVSYQFLYRHFTLKEYSKSNFKRKYMSSHFVSNRFSSNRQIVQKSTSRKELSVERSRNKRRVCILYRLNRQRVVKRLDYKTKCSSLLSS